MYLVRTCLFGKQVDVKFDTIEEVVDWATFHNLQYVKTSECVAFGLETFTVFTHDSSPLSPHAVQRLGDAKFAQYVPGYIKENLGITVGTGYATGRFKKLLGGIND